MPIELSILSIILIVLFLFIGLWIGSKFGAFKRDKFWERELPAHRKDAIMKSRAVLGGQFSEQLAPYLPDFPYLPTECRFIGKPIDFLVFKGMDDKKIDEVVFVEIKSGNAKLSPQEKNLKDAIEKKRVKFFEYHVPEDLTKKKDFDFLDSGKEI